MATIDLKSVAKENTDTADTGFAVVLDFEPYNGEVTIYVRAKTRTLLMQALAKAKKNRKFNRHTIEDPNVKGGKRVVPGDENVALMEELADLLIVDWEGVEDNGQPVECTRENKILLFDNLKLSNYILEVADDLGNTVNAEVQKKSKTS